MSHGELVDLHHHVIPPVLAETIARHTPIGTGGTSGLTMPPWSSDSALGFLDDAQISLAVASTGFGVHYGDDAEAVKVARECNDLIAGLVRDHPDRFGGFAVLPLPLVDASIAELDRALGELALDGVMLLTNYGGGYLGDPRFTPVFDALESHATTVFVHPTASPDAASHTLGVPDFLIDYVADTTRAVTRLHYSNTFVRTPSVRYVFSHAGGTIPYLMSRFDLLESVATLPGAQTRPSARDQFRRLYWDTALSFTDPVLHLLRDVVGIDQIVFGSDYPYGADLSRGAADAVLRTADLTETERTAIAHRNAGRLIPRLAQG
jgi:6-methylsalicylate decarboxylase